MRRSGRVEAGISGLLLVFGVAACFSPSFEPCAVTCGEASACPEGLVCLTDGWCHASGSEELCLPGQDGSVVDGSIDGPDGNGPPDASVADASDVDASDVDAGPPVAPTQAGDLVISEIHKNPSAAPDMFGEWFELYNPTGRTFNLLGLRVSDADMDEFIVDESVIVPPGGRVVLARTADMDVNGGVAVDFTYGVLVFALANVMDEIQIQNVEQQVVIDAVAYNMAFSNTDGRSMSLEPTLENETANNEAASWCDGSSLFGVGDFGTPGRPNDSCP